MKNLKYQDLVKGAIYTDILDPIIPLRFTGKITERNQYGSVCMIAYFEPVKTTKNKNFVGSYPSPTTRAFDLENGNQLITKAV